MEQLKIIFYLRINHLLQISPEQFYRVDMGNWALIPFFSRYTYSEYDWLYVTRFKYSEDKEKIYMISEAEERMWIFDKDYKYLGRKKI